MAMALSMSLLLPSRSMGHQLSINECKEASDFIRNAALARDHGIGEAAFINKISDDIEILRAFPSQLRWFVQDDEDANLLISAATNVFQHPESAHAHQINFFNDCVGHAKPTTNIHKNNM
jgi:hypothetical protein